MRVMVVGVEHSCTRFVTGLIKVHPQVGFVQHISVPTKTEWPDLEALWKKESLDKIVAVTRDRCSNDMSYLNSSSVALMCGKELSGRPLGSGADIARSHLKPFLKARRGRRRGRGVVPVQGARPSSNLQVTRA